MYFMNNDYSLRSEYNVRNGYMINHIPLVVSSTETGTVLFGEDPGNIIDEIQYKDQIEKLTR